MTIRRMECATPAGDASPGSRLRDTPRVLSIAGTDPTGGAGIQADLKSIGANGGYGMAVVTSLVAQNTRGVRSVHTPPASFLREQLQAVSDDVHIDAVKIGMLGDVETIATVRGWLAEVGPAVVVLDPVMVATSGDRLLADDAESALRALLPFADLVTPNVPELAVLVGEPVAETWDEAVEQGRRLSKATGTRVLVKGGHLPGSVCPDALVDSTAEQQVRVLAGPRIATGNTHGTGCSLSSALATVQARTGDWWESLVEVKRWLAGALEHAGSLEVGRGNGPIHHFHAWSGTRPQPFSAVAWEQTTPWRHRIHELPFIRGLRDGSLAPDHFAYYLAQDALYLRGYSRVLARASALAPTEAEQLFWAAGALNCIQVEAELHRNWLREQSPETAGPVTKAYVNHLLAASAGGSYGVLVAAVLPCYWLYADVGSALLDAWSRDGRDAAHPYAAWIETYADPAFAEATAQAISLADAAYAGASAGDRASMLEAFDDSARYELEFFDAPRHHG